jgi:hypothetical protein
MQLKSTTRHIRIYTAILEDNELVPSNDLLTLDIDPDNELNWNDESIKQVYAKFDQLVDAYEGEDLTEYNLRRIGSDWSTWYDRSSKKAKSATTSTAALSTTAWDCLKLIPKFTCKGDRHLCQLKIETDNKCRL